MSKITGIAYIWRKSIYDRNGFCGCGQKVMDTDSQPLDKTLVMQIEEGEKGLIFCPKCKTLIARYEPIEIEESSIPDDHKMGDWETFNRKKGMS